MPANDSYDQDKNSARIPISDNSPRVMSQLLLQGHRQLIIVHDGVEYRLQVTGQGKLILTK